MKVLVPIGMPLGLRRGDGQAVFHVRRGRRVLALDDDRLGAWHLARGMQHDRDSLTAAMRADGAGEPATAVDSLLAGGLLIEAAVSAEGALLLAAGYQMVPLMIGLDADAHGNRIVGLPGAVEHTVGEVFHHVFSRSTSTSTMLEAMVDTIEQVSPPQPLDVLATMLLGQLGEPLAHGIIALDIPRQPNGAKGTA